MVASPHSPPQFATPAESIDERIESLIRALWNMRDNIANLRTEFQPYASAAAVPGKDAEQRGQAQAAPGSADEVLLRVGLIERAIAEVVAVLAERPQAPIERGDVDGYLVGIDAQKAALLKRAGAAVAYLKIHSLQLTQSVTACRASMAESAAAIARARAGT